MSSSVGFLDFFILEAGEYIEQLDGFLASSGPTGPDGDAVQRAARSLRGSATMAKLPAFAELAHTLERMGRARRDGVLAWNPRLRGAAVGAVDELKILLRSVRNWGEEENERAVARTTELMALLPAPRTNPTPSTPSAMSGMGFLAGEASNVAAGLELLLTRPEDSGGATMVLRRVRALRGVAAVKDLPPIVSQVLEASEQAAQPLEKGERTLSSTQRDLMQASIDVLRSAGDSLRGGARVDAEGPAARRFGDALDAWLDSGSESERVLPIAALFHEDGGPHLVSAAAAPPTSPSERFRLELVSQGEHLRRLVDEARSAPDDAARERFRRELRRALRGVRALAESFEERGIESLSTQLMQAPSLDSATLDRLAGMSALLADPTLARETLDQRLGALGRSADTSPDEQEAGTVAEAAPVELPAPATHAPEAEFRSPLPDQGDEDVSVDDDVEVDERVQVEERVPESAIAPQERASAPTTSSRQTPSKLDLLDQGIAGLSRLEREPLGRPVRTPEQPIVPVEALIYRGRAAVRRAIELREELRRSGGSPSPEAVEELFDLMDLALLDEALV
jgi:chemotaxis protein histidine kinase CheA